MTYIIVWRKMGDNNANTAAIKITGLIINKLKLITHSALHSKFHYHEILVLA